MSKPTDNDLNRAMALACGWREVTPDRPHRCGSLMWTIGWVQPVTSWFEHCPDYCRDRNCLPEVWAAVESADKLDNLVVEDFNFFITAQAGWWNKNVLTVLKLPPRLHVEAALRALNLWKPEWSDE